MNCLICGKELDDAQRSTRKYCSYRCRWRAFKNRREKCPKCGYDLTSHKWCDDDGEEQPCQ